MEENIQYNMELGREVVDFLNELNRTETPSDYRRGQFMFNEFGDRFPEISRKIRGTKDDPYYDDKKIAAFFARAIVLAFESD